MVASSESPDEHTPKEPTVATTSKFRKVIYSSFFGLGLTVLGIVASTAWNTETIVTMKPGGSVEVAGRTLTMDGFLPVSGGTYTGPRRTY